MSAKPMGLPRLSRSNVDLYDCGKQHRTGHSDRRDIDRYVSGGPAERIVHQYRSGGATGNTASGTVTGSLIETLTLPANSSVTYTVTATVAANATGKSHEHGDGHWSERHKRFESQ